MHKLQVTSVKRKSCPSYAYTRHDYREEDEHGIRHIVRIIPILQVNTGNAANRSSATSTSKSNALLRRTTVKMEQSDSVNPSAEAKKPQQTAKSPLKLSDDQFSIETPPSPLTAPPTRPLTSPSTSLPQVWQKKSTTTTTLRMHDVFNSIEPLDATSDEEEIEEDLQEHPTDSDSDYENEAIQEMALVSVPQMCKNALYDIMEEAENVSSSMSVSERKSSHSASRQPSLKAPHSEGKMASLESHHSGDKMASLESHHSGDKMASLESHHSGDGVLSLLSHHSADGVLSLLSLHSGERRTSLKSDGKMPSLKSHNSESRADSLKLDDNEDRILSLQSDHSYNRVASFKSEASEDGDPSDHSYNRVASFKSEASGDGGLSDHSYNRVASFKSEASGDGDPSDHSYNRVASFKSEASGDGGPSDHSYNRVATFKSDGSQDDVMSLESHHSGDKIPSLKSDDHSDDKIPSLKSDKMASLQSDPIKVMAPKSHNSDSRLTSLEAPHKVLTSLESHHSDDKMKSLKSDQSDGKEVSLKSLQSDGKVASLNPLHSDGKEASLKSDRGQAKMGSLKSDRETSLKSDHSNSKETSLKSDHSGSKEKSLKSDPSQAKMRPQKLSQKSTKVDHSSMSDNEEADSNSKLPVSSETSLSHVKIDILQREPNSGGGGSTEQSQSYNTDYMTFQSDLGAATLDIYAELSKRDELIMKLTQSLQQSLNAREDQQEICDRLTDEINELRQQLQGALPMQKTSPKHRITGGEKAANEEPNLLPIPNISGRIEKFQKGLLPQELKNFSALQDKLQHFIADELQSLTAAHTVSIDELRKANSQKDGKIKQLEESMREKLVLHTKEMEELRKYFENKCVDLEKQFSDDVFSQKSQHHGSDTSSDFSDQEQKPSKEVAASKSLSPRKVAKLVATSGSSPAKTSTGAIAKEELAAKVSIEDLKTLYEKRRDDLQQIQDENLSKFSFNYNDNYFVDTDFKKHEAKKPIRSPLTDKQSDANRSGLILIDYDELNVENESRVIQAIVEEYEKRLQQQLVLAREDIVRELECQIQSLLSSESSDDHHWPPELILLREKLTAKSQIEIAQLQIKHEDEMSRLRSEYEKKLNRKRRRNLTFDSSRDVEGGGEGGKPEEGSALRQILHSYHSIVTDLSKCVLHCEAGDSTNASFLPPDDDKSLLERSTGVNGSLNASRQVSLLIPDVHSLLETVEDPQLLRFIAGSGSGQPEESFDLRDCLERLKREAAYLLQLSQGYAETKRSNLNPLDKGHASDEAVEEGDADPGNVCSRSLPSVWPAEAQDLPAQLQDMKNLLIKSEACRLKAQQDYESARMRCETLQKDVSLLRDKLAQLQALDRANVSHGEQYIESSCSVEGEEDSPSGPPLETFGKLQASARNVLSTPMDYSDGNTTLMLLQMIEDFCREGDKVIETFKGQHEDLRSQIGGADKQLKATRQFLEEQAAEREQERDEYLGEINRLEGLLRDKEKEKSSFESASRGMEQIQQQTSELMQKLKEANGVRDKFELELKASIDKIFVLREIITDLETQIETKSLNERALEEKIAHFEENIREHEFANESLQTEVQSLREDISHKYEKHIGELEEKLRNIRPAAEQLSLLEQLNDQLSTIETSLDQKTKVLELLQHSNTSNSCSEDISGQGALSAERLKKSVYFEENPSPRQLSATHEMVERIVEKLGKHSRIEEGVRKRVQDMDMQLGQLRGAMLELQQERDSLQERILEQTQRISGMQLRLDEQRQRNEEIQRAGTSTLNIRIHEMQTEVQNLNEALELRDKQIAAMKRQLDMSKLAIDRLEAELAVEHQPDVEVIGRLEADLKQKNAEIQLLKERIKTEMINKLALPDLMETMLADKNEEIDYLKEQLEIKEKKNPAGVSPSCGSASQSGGFMQLTGSSLGDGSKYSGPRVSTIVEFDEPDVVRRDVPANQSASLLLPDGKSELFNSEIDSLHTDADATHKYGANCKTLEKASTFKNPHYFQDKNFGSLADNRSLVPRQIDFSALVEDSRAKPLRLFSGQSETTERRTAEVAMQTTLADSIGKLEDVRISEEAADSLQESLEKLREEKNAEIERLQQEKEALAREQEGTKQKLAKSEADFRESEQRYLQRITELEKQVSANLDGEVAKRDDLRKELQSLSEIHGVVLREAEASRLEADSLRRELKAKQENILHLTGQLQAAERSSENLQTLVERLQGEMEAMRQQGSENNSKQISVDEIAKEVEKELNYSAQLDSNILRAIESEEDNNLCQQHFADKIAQLNNNNLLAAEEEHLLAERSLLNELEALRTQVQLGREQNDEFRKELIAEKQHSQEIQEQDMIVIEAMRSRLETAVEKQENLHKLLDIERSRCDRLQTQLAALQRLEARRKSLMLLKSPAPGSPPKSLRSLTEYDSKLGDRLRDSLRSLMAQMVGEPELGSTGDLRWCAERQQERHEEVNFYAERILQEIDELAQFHDTVKQEINHLNDLLKLKDEEIESYAMRLRAVQQVQTAGSPLKTEPGLDYKPLNVERRDSLSAFAFDGLEEAAARTPVDPVNSPPAHNANALNPYTVTSSSTVPQQFLKKILEINELLSENTQENCQMAGTVKFLVEDRRKLQKKCSDLKGQLAGCVTEMEERCNHLVGRYLRVESHRKSLVYQKRYLKICLDSYQKSEERVMANMRLAPKTPSRNRFRTVALCIIAIQRMKFIGRIWRSGKHSGSKIAFALSQNKGFKPPHAVAVHGKLKHSSHRSHDMPMAAPDSQSPAGR